MPRPVLALRRRGTARVSILIGECNVGRACATNFTRKLLQVPWQVQSRPKAGWRCAAPWAASIWPLQNQRAFGRARQRCRRAGHRWRSGRLRRQTPRLRSRQRRRRCHRGRRLGARTGMPGEAQWRRRRGVFEDCGAAAGSRDARAVREPPPHGALARALLRVVTPWRACLQRGVRRRSLCEPGFHERWLWWAIGVHVRMWP
mmetsp:Transcript_72459/g.200943  ORF Transcript_72459/g.200943 Transcript_72459/m.200943 type:complete len:202 (+) Transcript_72459:185-790(+)